MNRCIIIGNLTRDPDLRTLPSSGVAVCNFTVAVTRKYANQQGEREADFIPVVVWRAQAENCAKYLRRGSQVAVAGSIQTRSYEVEGSKRYVTEIVADEVQFLARTVGKGEQNASGDFMDSVQSGSSVTEIEDDLPF